MIAVCDGTVRRMRRDIICHGVHTAAAVPHAPTLAHTLYGGGEGGGHGDRGHKAEDEAGARPHKRKRGRAAREHRQAARAHRHIHANTGKPHAPIATYMTTAATACLRLNTTPAIITTSVCSVIGTGVPGIGMRPAAVAAHSSPAATTAGAHCSTNVRIVRREGTVISVFCISNPFVRHEGTVISVFCISNPFVRHAGPVCTCHAAMNMRKRTWKSSAGIWRATVASSPHNPRHQWQSDIRRAPAHPGRPPHIARHSPGPIRPKLTCALAAAGL